MKKLLTLLTFTFLLIGCSNPLSQIDAWTEVMETHYLGKFIQVGDKQLEIISYSDWDSSFTLSDGREVSSEFVINILGDSKEELEKEKDAILDK